MSNKIHYIYTRTVAINQIWATFNRGDTSSRMYSISHSRAVRLALDCYSIQLKNSVRMSFIPSLTSSPGWQLNIRRY